MHKSQSSNTGGQTLHATQMQLKLFSTYRNLTDVQTFQGLYHLMYL